MTVFVDFELNWPRVFFKLIVSLVTCKQNRTQNTVRKIIDAQNHSYYSILEVTWMDNNQNYRLSEILTKYLITHNWVTQ